MVAVLSKSKSAALYANADGGDVSENGARGQRFPDPTVIVELVLPALLCLLIKLALLFRSDIVDMDAKYYCHL